MRKVMTNSVKYSLMASVASVGLMLPAAAMAQDAEAEEDDNVITVIARKNEESLQDVPVTVTAIGGDTLERYGVDQVADVQSRVPSLVIQVGGSGSGGSVNLRGVGSSAISASFDSAVAFDIDGVQVSTSRLVQAGFFDAAQIDILKGPQSLFFGKSSTAGVFSLRSADPTPNWEIAGKGSYEFEEEGYTIGGYVSGPITDTLGIRVAAQYNDIDEFENIQPGTPNGRDARGQSNFVGRLTLDWEPLDNFNANFKFSYIRNENDGSNLLRDQDCGPNGVADPVVINVGFGFLGSVTIPNNADCNINDSLFPQVQSNPQQGVLGQAPAQSAGVDLFNENNGLSFGQTDVFFGRLKFEVGISDAITLTSTTGYLDFESIDRDVFSFVGVGGPGVVIDNAADLSLAGPLAVLNLLVPAGAPVAPNLVALGDTTGVALGAGGNLTQNVTRQLTQELRLSSDFDGPFNFQLGAFYETREIEFNAAEQAANLSLLFGPDPVTGNTFDYLREHTTDTEALSLFGSFDFDITDRLNLTAGIRWTDEQKSNQIEIPFVHGLFGLGFLSPITSGFRANRIEFSDSNFSPEASLTYKVTDDINVFAAFKTGFKSGGIDNSALPTSGLLNLASPDPATLQAAQDGLVFDSETAIGGEIGIKSQFADRTVTLNATAYHFVYDDLQVQLFDAVAIQFNTFNAGELTTTGVDVDWSWRTPVEGLTLSGTLAYLDSRFTDTFIVDEGADGISGGGDPANPASADDDNLDDRDSPRAPNFAGNIAADWFIPLGTSLELGLSGNLAYSDSYFAGQNTNLGTELVQDSFVTIDAGVSIGDAAFSYRYEFD